MSGTGCITEVSGCFSVSIDSDLEGYSGHTIHQVHGARYICHDVVRGSHSECSQP